MGGSYLKKSAVIDRDKGWKRALAYTMNAGWKRVKVGFPAGSLGLAAGGVAEYAAYNEDGTKNKDGSTHAVARPFMATSFEINKERYTAFLARAGARIMSGQQTAKGSLEQLGLMARNDIIRTITRWATLAPNAESATNRPSTIASKAKGRGVLQDSGTMRRSVAWELVSQPPKQGG